MLRRKTLTTSRVRVTQLALWSVLLLKRVVDADFGDYADPTFQCPAMITCRQVCVPDVNVCPSEMLCEGDSNNETSLNLCADGSCAEECSPDLVSPCSYECAPVACKKVILSLPLCSDQYSSYYSFEDTCGNAEEAQSVKLYSYGEAGFVFFYTWIISLAAAIVSWCAYNNKISPVPDCMKPLDMDDDMYSEDPRSQGSETAPAEFVSWQAGYKIHPVGRLIHICTLITLLGFHGLLAWLCIQYYVNQASITKLNQRFNDEQQILKIFEIVWMTAFVWTFTLKWPYSLESLFLRRCELSQATHVAVRVPIEAPKQSKNGGYLRYARHKLSSLRGVLDRVMSFIFSDVEFQLNKTRVWEYCRVKESLDGARYFSFKLRRYNLDHDRNRFVSLRWKIGHTVDEILVAGLAPAGLSNLEVEARRSAVGYNRIEMRKPNFFRSFFEEISKPFHVYQSFIVWSWMPWYYYHMALLLSSVVLISALTVSYFQYRNEHKLYQIAITAGKVTVTRDGAKVNVSQDELVPGDIVHLQPGHAFCDMVLVKSSVTLVDESALTGEATPVAKTALSDGDGKKAFNTVDNKRQTVLGGTCVLECEDSRAVVIQTASFTTRSELLREVFFHKGYKMKFELEKELVLTFLFLYAILGFALVLFFTNESPVYGWFYGLYVVGTVLPPLLPTVATVSVGVSDNRLARQKIMCARAESILVAGKVTRVFFDKTGTLTQGGLDIVSTRSAKFWTSYLRCEEMSLAMAVCHGLTRSTRGELIGNPIDRAMFEASGAFHQGNGAVTRILALDGELVEVVRTFDFDYDRMTQGVIVRMFDGRLFAFVKGSGESIANVCLKDTFPEDYRKVLRDNAKMGIYQISFAIKYIPRNVDLSKVTRDEVETAMTFVGILNLKNLLREEAPAVVKELGEGGVKSIMLTGDNVLTAVSVAREAGIIEANKLVLVGSVDANGDVSWVNESGVEVVVSTKKLQQFQKSDIQLALSGEAWAKLQTTDPGEAVQLMETMRVFGRCSPRHKVSVVSAFAEQGYTTLMCGDGGNDCGALKAAHVGVALSDAEASIVSPITSLDKSINAVPLLLREGRCALASAFASYKFMIMYGQVETISQLFNAYFVITFPDWCWFFLDGVWPMTLAFTLPLARSARKLSSTRPTASLLGPQTLSSVIGMLALNFAFTVSAVSFLTHQDWYKCRKWTDQDITSLNITDNYEIEVIFLVTGFQYIASAMTYNFGYEFRLSWFRNYVFVTLATLYTTLQFYITLNPGKLSCLFRVNCDNSNVVPSLLGTELIPIQNTFNTTEMPADFCRRLLGLMIANAAVIAAWDYIVVNGTRRYLAARRRRGNTQ